MARRWTRTAGPEHPVLFASEADIPPAPVLPDADAARELEAYRALLEEAEAMALDAAAAVPSGREIVVAGRREHSPADEAAAVLDDGTARLPLLLASTASAALRESLRARMLLVAGTTASAGGAAVLRVSAAHDLRRLAVERDALVRTTRTRG